MTHLAETIDRFRAAETTYYAQREVFLATIPPMLVAIVTAHIPDAVRIDFEASDQGEWIVLSSITDAAGDEHDDCDEWDEQGDIWDALQAVTWDRASYWGNGGAVIPGWVVENAKGGYYHLDIPTYLAAQVTP